MIIAIIGMGVGNLIKFFAVNYWMFLLGNLINFYFVSVDVQVIYINEDSPKKYRAIIFSIAKVLGVLSILVVPLLREIYITETNENWRPIFLYPAIAAGIIAIVAILFLNESKAYEKSSLQTSQEEQKQLSFRKAIKRLKASKVWPQYKWIIIILA